MELDGKVGQVEGINDRGGYRGSMDKMIKRRTKYRKKVKEKKVKHIRRNSSSSSESDSDVSTSLDDDSQRKRRQCHNQRQGNHRNAEGRKFQISHCN